MSSVSFKLDGFGNMVTIFRKMPEDGYRKPVMAAFKAAAIPVKETMVNYLPGYLKNLKKIIMIKPGKGKSLTLAVGAYGRKLIYRNRRGVEWDPYMLLYWHNYGTITRRSSMHEFKQNVRPKAMQRGGGIKAGMFMENAWAASADRAEKRFEQVYAWEHHRFLEKEAAK